MTEIYIHYNPFKLETEILIDNQPLKDHSNLSRYRNERLQLWVDQAIPMLVEELNEDQLSIRFYGTTHDFEDMKAMCELYNRKENASVRIEHLKAKETYDKFQELSELVEYMQQGPFEDLRTERVKRNFESALNSEFEISVIATMSSGKSTLINAMLGKEVMPFKNEACTAKIVNIKDMENIDVERARCVDEDGNEIVPMLPVDPDRMASYNEDERIARIYMEAELPEIKSHQINLVLVDTPGPNNSASQKHQDYTFGVLKDEDKPMILYVLNATQLQTDDDNQLLSVVADQMKVGGKQSKDRFIFAVNKVDAFDPEKGEDVESMLQNVTNYLKKHDIEEPNIYPISSEMAKLIRMEKNGKPLTRTQRNKLNGHNLFTEEPSMHMTQYTPLSKQRKDELNTCIRQAQAKGDTLLEALYHSGLPAIESAINEYLEKYAVTSKITNAVNSFRKILEKQQMMQNLHQKMLQDEQKRADIHHEMERIERDITEGQKAKAFKSRIQNLDFNEQAHIEAIDRKIETKFITLAQKFSDEKITATKAGAIIRKLTGEIEALQSDIMTDLEKMVKRSMKQQAESYLEEYKTYVKNIVRDANSTKLQWSDVSFMVSDLPDADELLERHTFNEDVKVGEKWVENTSKKWYKPWTWGQSKGHYKDVYENQQFVNVNELRGSFIQPLRSSLSENMNAALKHVAAEKNKLKAFFIAEIEKLEKLLLDKVQEVKRLSSDAALLEQQILENEEKKQWLDQFVRKLDAILDI
ncbi:dynamin family protein [Paenibacillus oryzisoli]|uniref:dynamin family protein n=1 Tax=Paenibacillus oryzisoli TaxID=1850517 RepID=UPI003D2A847A